MLHPRLHGYRQNISSIHLFIHSFFKLFPKTVWLRTSLAVACACVCVCIFLCLCSVGMCDVFGFPCGMCMHVHALGALNVGLLKKEETEFYGNSPE